MKGRRDVNFVFGVGMCAQALSLSLRKLDPELARGKESRRPFCFGIDCKELAGRRHRGLGVGGRPSYSELSPDNFEVVSRNFRRPARCAESLSSFFLFTDTA